MSKELSAKLGKVIESVELISINLKACNFDAFVPPEMISPDDVSIGINYEFTYTLVSEMSELFCFVRPVIKGELKKSQQFELIKGIAFEGSATFVARYKMSENQFQDEELSLFTKTNAFYNTYPYLREFLHATLSKMSVHGVILPLMKTPQLTSDHFFSSTLKADR